MDRPDQIAVVGERGTALLEVGLGGNGSSTRGERNEEHDTGQRRQAGYPDVTLAGYGSGSESTRTASDGSRLR